MPRRAKELSAVEIKRLNKTGYHAVGGVSGLYLQVLPPNAKSWILRASIGNKRREIGLGGYPDVTLAMARVKARDLREKIIAGIDPVQERKAAASQLKTQQASTITFDDAVEKYLANKQHEFKNAKHFAQWGSTLKTYASPFVGKMAVADIDLNHIIQILQPIWLDKTETAKRLRGRIENVLSWATVSGFRSGENPARWKGHLENVLPKPSKVSKVEHHKAIPWQQIHTFMTDLTSREGLAAKALELLILTATRSGEVRLATWDEIDLEQALWTIPEGRMKASKEHRVPLSQQAIKLLKSVPRMANDDHIFPAPRGGALSDMSISAVVKRMGVDAVPHGFRSTFRDWAAENTNYPNIVVEMALAHSIGNKVEAAYRRGDLLEKRTRLMNDWAIYCETTPHTGNVTTIMERLA